MACDRFVYWKEGKPRPTRDEVEKVIRDYFGEVATEVRWDRDRFYVILVGKQTHPLESVDPSHLAVVGLLHYRKLAAEGKASSKRWIEVWFDAECLDVITRMADPLTNACAKDLAWHIAGQWDGDLEAE
jgi:hypothetical protein